MRRPSSEIIQLLLLLLRWENAKVILAIIVSLLLFGLVRSWGTEVPNWAKLLVVLCGWMPVVMLVMFLLPSSYVNKKDDGESSESDT